ncbi:hypothetical protein A0H76_830 [Hepatospora eriocheir]|uniref:HAT C-terminal dimerisation domain-containing protein n=1 Tax=Hepatospora eriocheir TaxID=1081669 RepID=A0A1X0Q6M8_9MICR|nr:hypothetical protein A0H76_830 [Hepatospora eriocheir]
MERLNKLCSNHFLGFSIINNLNMNETENKEEILEFLVEKELSRIEKSVSENKIDSIKSILDNYKLTPRLSSNTDVLNYWELERRKGNLLSIIALNILSILSNQVSVERSFFRLKLYSK